MGSCCGAERSTTFCPDCGTRLRTSPLHELLVHCRRQASMHERHVKRQQRYVKPNDPDLTEGQTQRMARSVRHSERWNRYVVALQEAIAKKEADDAE